MRKQNSKIGVCVYCGKKTTITRDHIPPKNLFSKPRPSNLISVPSCFRCNTGFSLDDEYFRLVIAIRDDIANNTQNILPKVLRSLEKTEKIGFLNSFLNSIQVVENLKTELNNLDYEYKVDLSRLNNVAARIIKGLFYHHFKEIIPPEYSVYAFCSEGMKYLSSKSIIKIQNNIIIPISKQKVFKIEPIFEYKFIVNNENKFFSSWLIRFFKKVYFLGFTLPTIKEI